jgi:hypothetical protein
MASINLGVVGCIAASAAGFSTPAQTIATTSTGNYDMAFEVHPTGNVWPNHNVWPGGKMDGSQFTQTGNKESTGSMNWSTGSLNLWASSSYGAIQLYSGGYARHSLSSPSYTWEILGVSSSLSNGVTLALSPSVQYKTVQDCTGINDTASSTGICTGDQVSLTFGGGRGGILYPAAGDTMEWIVKMTLNTNVNLTFSSKVDITWVA